MVQQSLFYAAVIGRAGGPPVVFALPEPDGSFVHAKRGAERPLCQPGQDAGGAELASCNKVFAVQGLESLQ